jgi:transcriptional regulator of arginine metabolism
MNIHPPSDALRRRDGILRIVQAEPVHSQDELMARLRSRGFKVTQPTLSRDLRELGLVKTPTGYLAPGTIAIAPVAAFTLRESRLERVNRLIRDSVLAADAGGNLVVVKTPPAAAQPLASAIDTAELDDVLGTIGGDDTIFIALATPAAAADLARHIHETAGISPSRRRTRA